MNEPNRPLGGTGYYRLELPLRWLGLNGHETFIVPELRQNHKTGEIIGRTWNGDEIHNCDVVVTQRWMNDTGADFTLKARAAGQVVVGDVDDHYWALPTDNAAFFGTHPKTNPRANREHYKKQLAACSLVTVSTPLLASVVGRWNPNVELLRNAIDPRIWWRVPPNPGRAPRYGWTGGTLWRQRDLTMIAGYVNPFFQSHPELSFGHVGQRDDVPQVREVLKLPAHTVVHDYPQCPLPSFPTGCKEVGLEVMLVPLTDNSFNEAKSNLKGLEATAMEIPFIASASGEYKHLGVGRLVRKPRDWPHALREMLDPETRADHVKAQKARVAQEHIDVRVGDWEAAYSTALDKVK